MSITFPLLLLLLQQQQHLYNTYTPSSYGNLEPSSISYALVTPDLYNGNQTMALHSTMMRPNATIPSNQPSVAAAAALYNHTLPHNLRTYPFQCIDYILSLSAFLFSSALSAVET